MNDRTIYVSGGGIAGLAAAAYLIRDAGIPGSSIHILEQEGQFGGSLDGRGDAESGYLIRGGRMFEEHFACTYDLFSAIPSLDDPGVSVRDEIHRFTRDVHTSSRCRLVAGGIRQEAPAFGLSWRNKRDLARLSLCPENLLGAISIAEFFGQKFLTTNFWIMWCTMFAFQPWHSVVEMRRYMRRFMHLLPGFNRLEGIFRTPLNQYDSLVAPLLAWLESEGVHLHSGTCTTDLNFAQEHGITRVTGLQIEDSAGERHLPVRPEDLVLVTLGSMTADSSLGTLDTPAELTIDPATGAWPLWRKIASRSDDFGNPEAFAAHPAQSRWNSFTVTLTDPAYFQAMEDFTGNPAGTGGLVTFSESSWLMSIVLARQPHFRDQPPGVEVFWGYALRVDQPGDRVNKAMADCTGREILDELAWHLPFENSQELLASGNCIPCSLPWITSQFMPRIPGDRPSVNPPGAANFAFLGQFCEVPEDTVFTVEYSVRTAQMAVNELLGLNRSAQPIYRGFAKPGVLFRALRALLA